MLIAVAGVLGLVAIAVALIVVLSSSPESGNRNTAYAQKLSAALGPVVAANSSLSNRLQDLSGNNTTSATSATSQSQQAVTAARGAVAVLTVPGSSSQLSQQVQQALTQENGYLQAVVATLSSPTPTNSSQLRELATSAQSSLVPLAGVAPGISTSLNGADQLIAWANGQAAAAAKAAKKQAAKKPSSSPSSSPSPAPPSGAQAQGTDCGAGLHAGPNTSCQFAQNVRQAWDAAPAGVNTLQVFSPVTGLVYTMTCTQAGVGITCTGGNNASVSW